MYYCSPLNGCTDRLVNWIVTSFGGRRDCIFVEKKKKKKKRREKGRVPKVRARSNSGTLLPILGPPVTRAIDLFLGIKLGEAYLSIVDLRVFRI